MKTDTKKRRARLARNAERKTEALSHGYYVCEIKPLLIERGYLNRGEMCRGPLTFAHAVTRTHRKKSAEMGTAEHEDTGAYACELHHFYMLDIPSIVPRKVAKEIVLDAISRRKKREPVAPYVAEPCAPVLFTCSRCGEKTEAGRWTRWGTRCPLCGHIEDDWLSTLE